MKFNEKPLNLAGNRQYINIFAVTEPVRMDFIGTSYDSFAKAAKQIFGEFPIRLSKEHKPTIKAISIVLAENGTAWKQIYDSLEKYGNVELQIETE